ncbi:hypothetical protein V6N12_017075 [Hibiscus sabdariffa]|uniref:Uncharacterized protein n=1 Tax=Hibiscus sabdariffa TaxID=183260 RepID=A0ABR2AI38_9ROSI
MTDSPQSSPSRYNAHNPPSAKPLGVHGGEDPPQSGSGNSRHPQQISLVTVFPEKDHNRGDNQTSHENSRRHQQASPGAVLPENENTDNQSSHENSYHHHHHHQQASPATVLPENGIPHNQSSKKNSHQHQHQQHQSSQSGQVPPPGFHQEVEDQSLIQEKSVVEDQLYPPKDTKVTLTSSNPPVSSHGGNRDKPAEPKAHDQKTNIVHGGNVNVIVIHSHSHGQNPHAQAQPSEARLSKPPGYPNKSGPPKPPKKGICKQCLEKTFPCFF